MLTDYREHIECLPDGMRLLVVDESHVFTNREMAEIAGKIRHLAEHRHTQARIVALGGTGLGWSQWS